MSRITDVLIIGNSLAAYAAAYWLGKGGVKTSLVTVGRGGSGESAEIPYFAEGDSSQFFAKDLLQAGGEQILQRAVDQLSLIAPLAVQELLIDQLKIPFEKLENGSFKLTQGIGHSRPRILSYKGDLEKAIVEALLHEIATFENVTILARHTAVELLTFDHSSKPADSFRRSTCCGAYLLDRVSGEVESWLAKETIVATKGLDTLFYDHPVEHNDGLGLLSSTEVRMIYLNWLQKASGEIPFTPPSCQGGIFVEKGGLTSVQRLRVLGEWACTGVQGNLPVSGIQMLESFAWAKTAADEMVKQIQKFIYYTPLVKEWNNAKEAVSSDIIENDWQVFQQILWSYVGADMDAFRIARAIPLLKTLQASVEDTYRCYRSNAELIHLRHALRAALLVCQAVEKSAGFAQKDKILSQSSFSVEKMDAVRLG